MPSETLIPVVEHGLAGDLDLIAMIEKGLGNSSEEDVVAELGGRLENPKAVAYVDAIGQKLVSNTGRRDFGFKFDVIKNDAPNAFALPNGSIYITDGLLRMLRTEAQLANVLGHEVAHVTKHHTIDQIKANLLTKFGFDAFTTLFSRFLTRTLSADDQEMMKGAGFELITKGYSRKSESEADEVGQRIAGRSGWDPAGMVDVMSIFLSLEKGGRPSGIEAYMRSHPYPEDRMNEATSRLAPPPRGTVGKDEYAQFLADAFATPKTETELSPVEAAMKFVPGAGTAATLVENGKKKSSILVPALILGGGVVAIVVVLLLTRK